MKRFFAILFIMLGMTFSFQSAVAAVCTGFTTTFNSGTEVITFTFTDVSLFTTVGTTTHVAITVNSVTTTFSGSDVSVDATNKIITVDASSESYTSSDDISDLDFRTSTSSLHSCSGPIALPVKMTEFTITDTENGTVELNWITASELNNDRFEIERSTDGDTYEFIGIVAGNGTSNEINNYTYLDETAPTGPRIFYRLKQIDFDGKFTYYVRTTKRTDAVIDPIPKIVSVQYKEYTITDHDEPVKIEILNMQGVFVASTTLLPGDNTYQVSSHLASGAYIASFEIDGQVFARRTMAIRE